MKFSSKSLKHWMFGLIAVSSNFLAPLHATSLTSLYKEKVWYPVISLGVGGSFSNDIGDSQNFPIQNPIEDQFYNYAAGHTSQSSWLFNAFVGAEWAPCPFWLLQTGLSYYQTEPFTAKGNLIQGADIESADTYNYQYRISARQLLLEGKLLYSYKEIFHPYVSLGLGASFNRAYNFSTTVPPFLAFTREYANNRNTSFSYALGIGIDTDVACDVRLGIGYRFADFGQTKLGAATIDGTSVAGTLKQQHLYANEVIAQLTWLLI